MLLLCHKESIIKFSTLLKLIRFWPPFLGAGISVNNFSADYHSIEVEMKMRFWNKNYVGTHFGGSLYAMTDPFYMLMLLNLLGKEYIVWDKSSTIRYITPAKGPVFAKFVLSVENIEFIRTEINRVQKIHPEYIIEIRDKTGTIVAEVKKTLYIARK